MIALDYTVRPAASSDLPAVYTALAWAIDWRSATLGESPRKLVERTGHAYLLAGWGRDGDVAVIAETTSGPIGAAWYRFWTGAEHSYGYIAPDVPELGIGVAPDLRDQGVGTALIDSLVQIAMSEGIQRMSLSVERDNTAVSLYERIGFVRVEQTGDSWTMVRKLAGGDGHTPF